MPPELCEYFTEKPLYLPSLFQVSDQKRVIARIPPRDHFGLNDRDFVFCAFNNNHKFTPEIFESWMRILRATPHGVLWLLEDNRWSKTNLLAAAQAHGIAPERLHFTGRIAPSDYLARFAVADLFLDTTPYNAGTTARINDILFSQGILVAVGNTGVISESRDGTSWTLLDSGVKINLSAITTDGAVALTSGLNGLVLGSSGNYVVDFAVRGISFEMFNNNTLDVLTLKGYRVQNGQTCIWAQQEGFPRDQFRGPRFENDGWNNYESTFDNPTYDNVAFDVKALTTVLVTNPLPGNANLVITSVQGISAGDYVTVGSYKINAGVRVTAVYPLDNQISVNQNIVATQGEVISFYSPVGYDKIGRAHV